MTLGKKLGEGNENWESPQENQEGCNAGMQCLHLLYPKAINQEALGCEVFVPSRGLLSYAV